MKLKDFKRFKDLAEYVGLDEKALWDIIIGKVADSKEVAEKLSEVSGISPKTLMFETCVRMRPGFLEWFADRTGLSKTEVWHVFQGKRAVQEVWAKALAKFTGIPVLKWQQGIAWMICAKMTCDEEAA